LVFIHIELDGESVRLSMPSSGHAYAELLVVEELYRNQILLFLDNGGV
jgi:hypothetical protein